MCLARQVQLHNARRLGPLQALMPDEVAANAAQQTGLNPRLLGFGSMPWPHPSQHSLDSQVSRTQLSQAALDKANFLKVQTFFAFSIERFS